jgi:hypothetical protein
MSRITLKSYIFNLSDENDVCKEFVDDVCDVCDISIYNMYYTIADNNVDIDTQTLWGKGLKFSDYIDDVLVCCEPNTSILELLQLGQFEYYKDMLYRNENKMFFNAVAIYVNESDDIRADKITEEMIENAINKIDDDDTMDIFRKIYEELLD